MPALCSSLDQNALDFAQAGVLCVWSRLATKKKKPNEEKKNLLFFR